MGRQTTVSFPVFLGVLVVSVVLHPVVLAEAAWEEDGWLRTSFAKERLDLGDEFGCYGMPGLSWSNDPGAVANACKAYIEERTNASRWGVSPLSTYTPATLTMADHTKVASLILFEKKFSPQIGFDQSSNIVFYLVHTPFVYFLFHTP